MRAAVSTSTSAPAGWDDYVHAHPHASPYHLASSIGIGRRAFGFDCFFLSAHGADGRLTGVLPLVEQAGLLGGRSLVSLPFFNYGGILADDASVSAALAQGAEQLARDRRAKQVELRHAHEAGEIAWPARLDKISMLLELPETVEELSKRLGSKLRSQIKRAERENPQIRVGGAELLGDFYPVFCSVMRDLGTPVYPRKFFEDVFACLGERAHIVIVSVAGKPASGAVLVRWKDTMEIPWASTLSAYRTTAINMRLYWEVLQFTVAQGCKRFDFGRSTKDSGTHRFKAQWGAQPLQLRWLRWAANAEAHGPAAEGRSNLELAVKAWSKLPLPVANWLGPIISPRLPW